MTERMTAQQLYALAARAVVKVDLLGPRGTTLCKMDEIEAIAALLAISGAIPAPQLAAAYQERKSDD